MCPYKSGHNPKYPIRNIERNNVSRQRILSIISPIEMHTTIVSLTYYTRRWLSPHACKR